MNPHDGELTFLGRILAALPVDVKIGKLIVMGYVFGCLKECLIIGENQVYLDMENSMLLTCYWGAGYSLLV